MFPMSFIHIQCKMIAQCFVNSGISGVDSDVFCEQFLTSDYGYSILTDQRMTEYADANFMYEGLERELPLKKGLCYEADILYFAGYLYKYWISTKETDPRAIWKIAPISLIAERYGFYHTQGYDYVIADLIDRH